MIIVSIVIRHLVYNVCHRTSSVHRQYVKGVYRIVRYVRVAYVLNVVMVTTLLIIT